MKDYMFILTATQHKIISANSKEEAEDIFNNISNEELAEDWNIDVDEILEEQDDDEDMNDPDPSRQQILEDCNPDLFN